MIVRYTNRVAGIKISIEHHNLAFCCILQIERTVVTCFVSCPRHGLVDGIEFICHSSSEFDFSGLERKY